MGELKEIDEMSVEEKIMQKYGDQYKNIKDIKDYITFENGQICRKVTFIAEITERL